MPSDKAAVLAVDFAPRHSAAALLSGDGALLGFSTLDAGPESDGFLSHAEALRKWVDSLQEMARGPEFERFVPDIRFVIEEVPSHTLAKPAQVLRLQGAFRVFVAQAGFSEPVMVGPSTWQNFFGWRKTEGMTSKGFAKFACSVLGYEISNTSGKQTVDVRDAILIGRWLVESGKVEQ